MDKVLKIKVIFADGHEMIRKMDKKQYAEFKEMAIRNSNIDDFFIVKDK